MTKWTQADVDAVTRRKVLTRGKHKDTPSKYHNVKKVVDGVKFDSSKEADAYINLLIRLKIGEIKDLRLQVPFDLLAPDLVNGGHVVVARYVADFSYAEHLTGDTWRPVVLDVKSAGTKTVLYALKAKWLFLQTGIVIEEM